MERLFFGLGSVLALLSVAIGAFGAHVLTPRLSQKALESFHTAARYQMFHALALLFTAWAATRFPGGPIRVAGFSFLAGIVLFCGSLYALALGSPRAFGAVAPIGGVAFMVGWGCLAAAAFLSRT
jgi:uncharacterized membrane protein YgdD (TMEM256/DUF423 family)